MHSLIGDPIFEVRLQGQDSPIHLTLPAVFEALRSEKLTEFVNITKPQQRVWHCFLAQLGALMYLNGEGETAREQLLSLTDGKLAPWELVNEDHSQPAFLQPRFDLRKNDYKVKSIDDVSRERRAKDFDLKQDAAQRLTPDQVTYALVELQTAGPLSGRGNYGTARMYSGFGSRAFITVTPSLNPSIWHNLDVRMLMRIKDEIALPNDGDALLWIKDWDGGKSSGLDAYELHPLFIEICRLVRIEPDFSVLSKTTDGARIAYEKDDDVYLGTLSAIWSPLNKQHKKGITAYTPGQGKPLSYKRINKLLWGTNGEFEPSKAMKFRDGEDKKYAVCHVFVGGQGKTYGLHERIIEIPSGLGAIFNGGAQTDKLRQESQTRITQAGAAERTLRGTLSRLLGTESQKEQPDFSATHYINAFTSEVDQVFFDNIWEAADQDEQAKKEWREFLVRRMSAAVQDAEDSMTCSGARRWSRLSKARKYFSDYVYKQFRYHVKFDAPSGFVLREAA